jgi:tRNA-dihydrouridine synthase B
MIQIDSISLKTNVVPAPLAGISDKAFRFLARENGCDLVYTEMISDKALLHKNKHTFELLDLTGEKEPIAVQLFGSEPENMAAAAKIAVDHGATIIDINMGCPSPKIVKNGEGAALMRTPELAFKIVGKVAGSVNVPVTVKMRKGWDKDNVNAVEMAKGVVESGAKAVTIHGRTRDQFYTRQADWGIIAQVVEEVNVPVFGNGDILVPEDAARMLEQTKCAGVMIARGSFGNPWLFKRTIAYLNKGDILPEPTMAEKVQVALRHLDMVVQYKGEKIGVKEMRKHLSWYIKGGREAAKTREEINKEEEYVKVKAILENFLQQQ